MDTRGTLPRLLADVGKQSRPGLSSTDGFERFKYREHRFDLEPTQKNQVTA
jgi:hypothetical protein